MFTHGLALLEGSSGLRSVDDAVSIGTGNSLHLTSEVSGCMLTSTGARDPTTL